VQSVATNIVRDGVAQITFGVPPLNTLDLALRRALDRALADAIADPQVRVIVILARGQAFSVGTELAPPDLPPWAARPDLAALCDRVESCPVPVVMLLPGHALGAGAEFALAGHYRLAMAQATIGLPEVKLGLPPGGGGSQRLARLAGARGALEMLLGGRPVAAAAAQAMGLVDGIVQGDLAQGGLAFAESLLARGALARPTGPRRDRMQDGRAWLQAVAHARAAQGPGVSLVADRIIDCVEAAALLPLQAGVAFEQAARADCSAGPVAAALHHVARSERRATPALLARGADGRRGLTAAGQALAARLAQALGRAAGVLSAAGPGRAAVDGALVAWGFAAGPFGGVVAVDDAAAPVQQRRVLAALVAEGARCLAQDTALRPGDIDAIAVQALGFPRDRGGPLHAATTAGLSALIAEMASWAAEDAVWDAPPLLARAAQTGGFSPE